MKKGRRNRERGSPRITLREIADYCSLHCIRAARSYKSFYFWHDGMKYRVSDHPISILWPDDDAYLIYVDRPMEDLIEIHQAVTCGYQVDHQGRIERSAQQKGRQLMLPETTDTYSDGIESYAVGSMPIMSSDWFYDRETDQYTGENLDVFTTGRVYLNFEGKTSTWTVDAQEENLEYRTIGMGDTPFKAVTKAITDTKTTIFWDHSRIHENVLEDLDRAERAIFRDVWPDKEVK